MLTRCHGCHLLVLREAPLMTRVPGVMLTPTAFCLLCSYAGLLRCSDRGPGIHHSHRALAVLTVCRPQKWQLLRGGWPQLQLPPSIAVDCFLRTAKEVRARLQHATARPAYIARDPGASDAHAHLKK